MIQFIIKAIRIFFVDYCNNSTIHGFRYISDRGRHWSERLWWLISIGLALLVCGLMIRNVWIEWNEPRIDFSEEHMSMVPFPTVTICMEIKALKQKLDISSKFGKNLKPIANLSEIELMQLNAMAHVCPQLQYLFEVKDEFTNDSIYNIIEDVAPKLEHTIRECRWQQKKINCSEHMKPVLTRDGLCFAFNGLNFNDMYTNQVTPPTKVSMKNRNMSGWSLENGYEKRFNSHEYPIRPFDSGRKGALELVLSNEMQSHDDVFCNGIRQGFIVFLTPPDESIEFRPFLQTEFSDNTIITVTPKITTTSKELRSYKPAQRGCFFNSERQLRFFKSYTDVNCKVECSANLTKRVCGCVGFSMPRNVNDTVICSGAKFSCHKIPHLENRFKSDASFELECNCMPSCTSIEYETKVDRTKLLRTSVEKNRRSQPNDFGRQQTRLTIFYETEKIEMKKRVERYSVGEFMAICGGILGLLLGISFVSIIELIYYPSLRLFWMIFRPRPKEKNDQSNHGKTDAISDGQIVFTNPMAQKIFLFALKIRKYFMEYCDNSNMHGFRYFSVRKLHWSERLFWLLSFIVSLSMCGLMTRNVWIQWAEEPVKICWTGKPVPAQSLPFPTVTICPEIKTTRDKLDVAKALNALSNLSEIEMTRLNALTHICPNLPPYNDNFTDESIYDTIQDIAPSIRQSTILCMWQRRSAKCFELFSPVLTEEGLCFTFNAQNSHEIYTDEMAPEMMIVKNNPNVSGWSLESGYLNESAEGNYPFQMHHNNISTTMAVFLKFDPNDVEYQCRGVDKGFKLFLSMPGEIVQTSQNHLRLPSSYQSIVSIRSKVTITSDGLRGYTPNQRQCYYSSDHPLRFFKIYTKKNCEVECRANFTLIECGCVKFSMPRDKHTKICGGANVKCYMAAQRNLFISERGEIFRDKCNCLPSCMNIEYTAKFQRTEFDNAKVYKLVQTKGIQSSIVGLGSDLVQAETIKRNEVYSFIEFMGACGGLLGLCVGASAMSIIEIIYFATLRLFWYIKMQRKIHGVQT